MSLPDPHTVLGVSPSASTEDIQKAYRRAALRLHPDRNPDDPDATHNMQRLNEARTRLMTGKSPRSQQPESPAADAKKEENLRRAFDDLLHAEHEALVSIERYLEALQANLRTLQDVQTRRLFLTTHCRIMADMLERNPYLASLLIPVALAERLEQCPSQLFDTVLRVSPGSFTLRHYNAYIHSIGQMPGGSPQRLAQAEPLRRLVSARPDLVMASGKARPAYEPPRDVWSL